MIDGFCKHDWELSPQILIKLFFSKQHKLYGEPEPN